MKTNYVIPEVQVLTLGTESFLMTSGTGEGTGSDIDLLPGSGFGDLFGVSAIDSPWVL